MVSLQTYLQHCRLCSVRSLQLHVCLYVCLPWIVFFFFWVQIEMEKFRTKLWWIDLNDVLLSTSAAIQCRICFSVNMVDLDSQVMWKKLFNSSRRSPWTSPWPIDLWTIWMTFLLSTSAATQRKPFFHATLNLVFMRIVIVATLNVLMRSFLSSSQTNGWSLISFSSNFCHRNIKILIYTYLFIKLCIFLFKLLCTIVFSSNNYLGTTI